MKLAKVLTGLVFAGGTTIAAVGSLANIGVPAADEPQGVSLRQESTGPGLQDSSPDTAPTAAADSAVASREVPR
jgi:hypothetical protein